MTAQRVQPRPAATIVLLRPGSDGLEALLTHRPSTMVFAPDMHVFPGGRVDAGDADPRLVERSAISGATAAVALGGDLAPGAALDAYVAAIRECFEESGVLLADVPRGLDVPAALAVARGRLLRDAGAFAELVDELDLRLRTDLLVPLSRWVTPAGMPRRFDARFFAAALPIGAEASLVGQEVVAHAWHTPRSALDAMAEGVIGMWAPTSTTLQQLEHARSIDEIRDRATPRDLGSIVIERVDEDVVRIEMPAAGGVAGQPVNAYLAGRSAYVLVDPGDPTGPGVDAAITAARERGGRIVAVALTHADPDHAAGAESVAVQLGVPVHAPAGRSRDLSFKVTTMVDGDVVPGSDVPLRVVETPGPTPDHVAFVVGEGRLALVGDLDRVRGSRSIVGPTDVAAWSRSEARLRSVAPAARWLGGHPR